MAVLWPFPGTDEPHGPPKPLPPTRFAVGDLVTTGWGRATVIAICGWAYDDGRAILVKHDWSSAPPGFGHTFSDADIELRVEQPSDGEDAEEFHPAEEPRRAVTAVDRPAQGSLF